MLLCRKLFLLLRKYTKIVASTAALFGSDINQIIGSLGFTSDPITGEAYSAPPAPLAVLGGLLLTEGREGKGRRKEEEGSEGERGEEGRAPIKMLPPKPKY